MLTGGRDPYGNAGPGFACGSFQVPINCKVHFSFCEYPDPFDSDRIENSAFRKWPFIY